MRAKSVMIVAVMTALILLAPWVAMQFTDEVFWSASDFVFAGTLIFGVGCLFEFIRIRAAGNGAYKIAAGLALGTGFLLIWINGAVGIIGDSDVNMLYAAVGLTLLIGAVAARLKPRGLSFALYATAFVQFLIPVAALILGTADFSPGVAQVFLLNGIFVLMFAGAGVLFRRAIPPQIPAQ